MDQKNAKYFIITKETTCFSTLTWFFCYLVIFNIHFIFRLSTMMTTSTLALALFPQSILLRYLKD